jgi:hypothetical protein
MLALGSTGAGFSFSHELRTRAALAAADQSNDLHRFISTSSIK